MKRLYSILWVALLLTGINSSAQSVSGKWYGVGNANIDGAANNYLIELVLVQKGSTVTGEFNYFFKNAYFPTRISGNYDSRSRRLSLKTTPVTYFRSSAVNGVECSMNGEFTLLVTKAGSSLKGKFSSTSFYSLTCPDIVMNLNPAKEEKQERESLIIPEKDLGQHEEKQIDAAMTVMPVTFRDLSTTEKQYVQRKNVEMGTIEVDSSDLTIELIDNGEVDKDSISIFFNGHMLANKLELTKRGLVYAIKLDQGRPVNEISMFAENLGIIPPNTALLVLYDGKKRYEINLTSTLQTNGTVRLKKREEPVQQ